MAEINHMIVREAIPEDAGGIAIVNHMAIQTLRTIYLPNEKVLSDRGKIEEQLCRLVAEEDDTIIGTVSYYFDGEILRALGLGVHAEHRRNGVATLLMKQIEQVAIDNGKAKIHLHTIKQTGNCRIFERMGFSTIREEVDHCAVSDKHDLLIDALMEKEVERLALAPIARRPRKKTRPPAKNLDNGCR